MTERPSDAELAIAVLQTKFDDLQQGLRNANSMPGRSPVSSPLLALSQILLFLNSFEGLRSLTGPLEMLRAALDDVRRGIHAPLFEPVDVVTNRGLDSNRERKIKAAAVLATELLYQSGIPVGDAIEQIRLKLLAAGVRLGRSKPRDISTSALSKWRERASDNGDDRFSASAMAAVQADLKQGGEWPPTKLRAIKMVDSIVSELRLAKI